MLFTGEVFEMDSIPMARRYYFRKIYRKGVYICSRKIDELPTDFTMQLDLGTTETQFYGNPIKPYLYEYPSLANKLDSMQHHKDIIFKNVNLHMGTAEFSLDVMHRIGFGEDIPLDLTHSKNPKHIGTIAPDMFRDKILIIDYKSRRFAVSDSLPAEYLSLPSVQFELNNGIIIFPFRIDGTECKLMFDTGSSPFPLATSKGRALEIAQRDSGRKMYLTLFIFGG